jgi:hypothetical protein
MITLATAMAIVRGLHVAATLSLLGTVGFVAWMLPAASDVSDTLRRRLIRLWWISGLMSLVAGAIWFTIQSAVIADAGNLTDLRDALPVVALHTRYGNVVMVRLLLVLLTTLLAGRTLAAPAQPRVRSATGWYSPKRCIFSPPASGSARFSRFG